MTGAGVAGTSPAAADAAPHLWAGTELPIAACSNVDASGGVDSV